MKPGKINGLLKACLCFALSIGAFVTCVVVFMVLAKVLNNEFLIRIFEVTEEKSAWDKAMGNLIGSIVQDTALIVVPILLALYGWKNKLADLGLTSFRKDGKQFMAGLLAGTVGITIVLFCLLVSGSVKVSGFSLQYIAEIGLGLLAYIVVGFAEEIFNRGGLMLALRETKNKVLIIGIPALIFGSLHLGNSGVTFSAIFNLVLFGVLMGYYFYQSGSLWMPIGFHIAWNFVQGNVYGFHVSGTSDCSFMSMKIVKENALTGGTFGPEGGIGVTIVLLILFGVSICYYRKRPKSIFEQE